MAEELGFEESNAEYKFSDDMLKTLTSGVPRFRNNFKNSARQVVNTHWQFETLPAAERQELATELVKANRFTYQNTAQLKNPYEHGSIFDVMKTVLEIRSQGVQGTYGTRFSSRIDQMFGKPQLMALAITALELGLLEWAGADQGNRSDIKFTADEFAPRYSNHLLSINKFQAVYPSRWNTVITKLKSKAKQAVGVCELAMEIQPVVIDWQSRGEDLFDDNDEELEADG